jgi:hypothetical protein
MEWALDTFLRTFWFLGGIAAVLNLFVYRRVFDQSCSDSEVAREAYQDFRLMMLWVAAVSVALGVIQAAGGFGYPIFPFEWPGSGSTAATISWVVVLAGLVALAVFLNSRRRPVAHLLARVMLAGAASGGVALAIVNTALVATISGLVVSALVAALLR